jgi:ribosomal-protein-alanine N-acetyltransferase
MSLETSFIELPRLETERLILRQITDSTDDGRDSLEFINDYSVYRYWGTYDEAGDEKGHRKPKRKIKLDYHYRTTMKEFRAKRELSWLMVLKHSGKVIGEVVLYDFKLKKQADIGYRVNKNYWGQGFATEACKAVIEFAFKDLGLSRIQIRCFKDNTGSVRVAEKLGFKKEGFIRMGALINVITDYYIYGLLSDEYRG